MFSLHDLCTAIESDSVSVFDKNNTKFDFIVRSLPGWQEQAIINALPTPTVPTTPDPSKGSLAPPIKNFDDPGFQHAFRMVQYARKLAYIAASTNYTLKNAAEPVTGFSWDDVVAGGREKLKSEHVLAYVTAAVAELERLDSAIATGLYDKASSLGALSFEALEKAEKN